VLRLCGAPTSRGNAWRAKGLILVKGAFLVLVELNPMIRIQPILQAKKRGNKPQSRGNGRSALPAPFSVLSNLFKEYANRSSRLVQIRPGKDRNSALEREVNFREVYS
jgi:hypothetical protein